ncbi:DMT family transporter [Luteimonas sp. Y-2-2-4F]|nr:DMT family transporter [Luteimonas sp. Y-2-2-4F]MCD9032167.1 DMT family transporter [Luteimonas sp. Y-2-2-4F]
MTELGALALVAMACGACFGINRALLGRVGRRLGAPGASVVNHIGGALFLLPLVALLPAGAPQLFAAALRAPWYAFLGGAIGALFVMITSWVIPRIGVMKTTVLFVSGQMVTSTLIDLVQDRLQSPPRAAAGVALIVAGVVLGEVFKQRARREAD